MHDTAFEEKIRSDRDCLQDIYGQDSAKEQLRSALLVGRHVLIMGPPGIGKTTIARNVAKLLSPLKLSDCPYHCDPQKPLCPECKAGRSEVRLVPGSERFVRVQGSPDLTSEDLLGDIDPVKALEFGPFSLEAFTPGKIFKANHGVLFFDELNRAPERLQNALLQVLEEHQATLGNYDIDFESDFIFIGTMNPHDASTERLSDVLLDRFDIVYMDYPESLQIEERVVTQKGTRIVDFPSALLQTTLEFVRSLRGHPQLERYPSLRASIGVYERAQALAQLRGSGEVHVHDVRDAVISVLAHRIALKSSIKYLKDPKDLLREEFEKSFAASQAKNERGGEG